MTAPPTDVVDRLERLAAHAPAHGLDVDAVWARGRRRQARTWSVATACAVVLAGVGSLVVPPVLRSAEPPVAVAPEDAVLVLPDAPREPGGWEPAFPDAPGPLSAVGLGSRAGWFSDGAPWWGISGTTGESRFLDLPDASTEIDAEPVLSADGTRVAYWITGEVPDPVPGLEEVRRGAPVVGVAVLDLRSGATTTWRRDTPRGMAIVGMAWSGSVLWWSGGDWDETTDASGGGYQVVTRTWDLATDERAEVRSGPGKALVGLAAAGAWSGGFVVRDGRQLLRVDGTEVVVAGPVDRGLRSQAWSHPAPSPDGAYLAGIEEPDEASVDDRPRRLLVGRLGAPRSDGGTTDLQPVGDVEALAVLGWRSSREVVVLTADDGLRAAAEVVDVVTGDVRPLVDLSDPVNLPDVAASAWAGRVVPTPDAPFAPDPRLVGGGLLTGCLTLWWVLRRRTRRVHA